MANNLDVILILAKAAAHTPKPQELDLEFELSRS